MTATSSKLKLKVCPVVLFNILYSRVPNTRGLNKQNEQGVLILGVIINGGRGWEPLKETSKRKS